MQQQQPKAVGTRNEKKKKRVVHIQIFIHTKKKTTPTHIKVLFLHLYQVLLLHSILRYLCVAKTLLCVFYYFNILRIKAKKGVYYGDGRPIDAHPIYNITAHVRPTRTMRKNRRVIAWHAFQISK